MGYVVKETFGDMEDNTKEDRSRRIIIERMGCVQAVVGKEKFLLQFENDQKKEMSSC